MRPYELIVIINTDLDENETNGIIEGVKGTIESGDGKVLKVDTWGKKRMAYPIKRQRDGYYVLIIFEKEPAAIRELNTALQITEPILRHMIVGFEGDLDRLIASSDAEKAAEKSQADEGEEGMPDRGSEDDDDEEEDEDDTSDDEDNGDEDDSDEHESSDKS